MTKCRGSMQQALTDVVDILKRNYRVAKNTAPDSYTSFIFPCSWQERGRACAMNTVLELNTFFKISN